MAIDTAKNFAKVTVSTGYDDNDTSIDLASGHGARLPAFPFNATWWNATDYADPSDDPDVEIVRVTNVSSDTLTVARAQEGTAASAKNTGGKTYKMVAALTAKALNTDLPATYGALASANVWAEFQQFHDGVAFKGPSPWVDVMSSALTRKCSGILTATTGSITSGTNTLVVASATGWEVGHGIAVIRDDNVLFTSYVTDIAGTTFTLNDNATGTATAKAVYHDDTLAIQDAIDSVSTGGAVFIPKGTYYIRQLKLYSNVALRGAGVGSTLLGSLPANTSNMLVLNAAGVVNTTVESFTMTGLKSSSPAPSFAAMAKIDNTIGSGGHRWSNLYFVSGPNDGLSMTGTYESMFHNVFIDACNGHALRDDANCFFNEFSNLMIKNPGLHGVYSLGGANLYTNARVYGAGQVDAVTSGDGWYFGTGSHGHIIDGYSSDCLRSAVHFDTGTGDPSGRINLRLVVHSTDGYYVTFTSGQSNTVRIMANGKPRLTANGLLNMAGGTVNDIEIIYNINSMGANTVPAVGAALSGSDNYINIRNGSKQGAGDICVFECEELYKVEPWTRTSPTTCWRFPGSTVYRMPG